MFVTDFSQYANLLRQKQKLSQEVLLSAFLPQNTADYTVTVYIIDKLCTNVKKLLNIAKYIALQGSGCYNAIKRTEQPHIKRVFVPQGSRLQYRRFQLRRKGEFDEYAI